MKDLRTLNQYIHKYLAPHKKMIMTFNLFFILNNLVMMGNSFMLGYAVDSMLEEANLKAIIRLAVLFLLLNALAFVVNYFAQIIGARTMEISRLECKMQIAKHIEKTSLSYCGNVGSAEFMQKLNYDASLLVISLLNAYAQIPSYAIQFVVAFIIIFSLNWVCGLAALAEIPIIIVLYKIFQNPMKKRNKEMTEAFEGEAKKLYELLADTRHIKINQIYPLLEKRYQNAGNIAVEKRVQSEKISYLYKMINDNMDIFLKIFLFFYGGISVIKGTMSVGDFTIIYSYFALITASCAYFLGLGKEIQTDMGYYERLRTITDVSEETNGIKILEHIDNIELSHVKFSYGNGDVILKDFSHRFEKGKMYAIAGGNGCGKSTMISLLLGMYLDEREGKILYNNCEIKDLDMRQLRQKKIGVCEQEPYLINDTIRYNVVFNNEPAEDERIYNLAQKVSFEEYLRESENGLATKVGEGGSALSGGQKQKTALMKIFFKNPDVLVLDEPTSAMDSAGKKILMDYLDSLRKDKIIIVITHDETIMEKADEVIRMSHR